LSNNKEVQGQGKKVPTSKQGTADHRGRANRSHKVGSKNTPQSFLERQPHATGRQRKRKKKPQEQAAIFQKKKQESYYITTGGDWKNQIVLGRGA